MWDIDDVSVLVSPCFRHHAAFVVRLHTDTKQGTILDIDMSEFETRMY